jgi:hypothetical protein
LLGRSAADGKDGARVLEVGTLRRWTAHRVMEPAQQCMGFESPRGHIGAR